MDKGMMANKSEDITTSIRGSRMQAEAHMPNCFQGTQLLE